MSELARQDLYEFISPSSKPLITESVEGDLVLKGLFIQGDVENHNGRVYPRMEIERAVTQINRKIMEIGPVVGELDHPDGLGINLKNASHAITKMWMEGPNGFGTMKIMKEGEPASIVRGLIGIGVQLGVSSRGSGAVGSNGRVSEFDIVTIDIVANPSAPDALPKPLRESLERYYSGRKVTNLASALNQDYSAQRHFRRALLEFAADLQNDLTRGSV